MGTIGPAAGPRGSTHTIGINVLGDGLGETGVGDMGEVPWVDGAAAVTHPNLAVGPRLPWRRGRVKDGRARKASGAPPRLVVALWHPHSSGSSGGEDGR